MSAAPPHIALRAEPVEPSIFEGGPVLVILELRVVTSALSAHIPNVLDPTFLCPSGLGLRAREEGEPPRTVLPSLPDPEWHPVRDLDSTGSRRAVVDLSPFTGSVRRGRLSLRVLAATPFGVTSSDELTLPVTPPSGPVAELFSAVRRELPPGGGWLDWVELESPSPLDARPLADLGPLALHGLLRRLRADPAAVREADLAALGPKLAPEQLAFLAERAAAMGDGAAAARWIAAARAVAPGLCSWLDDVERRRTTWTGAGLAAGRGGPRAASR
ncbi:MAG: hypothetical protein U0359_29060 [Byssovorax sp.]